jgi:hypothetical protein
MTKRFLLVGLLIVAAGSAVAQAATTPAKHKVSESLAVRVLTSSSTGAVFTGTIKDKALGSGAVIVNAIGAADATTNTLTGTGFFKTGTISVKGSVTTTARADGSGFDYAGTATAVKGTGVLKGVKGKLKLVGSAEAADPAYQIYSATGTLTY